MEILNVCGGLLGDVFLVKTKHKVAIFDAGTPIEAEKLLENIEKVADKVDYIFLTHTHYDHLGGAAYIKEKYPNAVIVGSAYAKKILEKETALKAIRDMATTDDFIPTYKDEFLKIDRVMEDFEELCDQDLKIKAFETIGHTKCAMSFLINDEVLLATESVGYMDKSGGVHSAFLVGFDHAIKSIEKCKKIKPKYVIAPHYGIRADADKYFDECLLSINKIRDFILDTGKKESNQEQICQKFIEQFYTKENAIQQPYKAFLVNSQIMIRNILG